ncbi:hypothetical protein ACFP7A_12900 [Sporolactobacillus kofuensis]|uniref:Uncharacterized protein n=1 Tax=Sporolactobacillus kofuensis TaxID=269672 RepID=A0ABW1WJG4_9BACL
MPVRVIACSKRAIEAHGYKDKDWTGLVPSFSQELETIRWFSKNSRDARRQRDQRAGETPQTFACSSDRLQQASNRSTWIQG